MSSSYNVKDFIPSKHLVICPLVNKEALERKRVFITDSTKKNYVYLTSEILFVESVEGKIIKCRVIDDETKSMLDELDYFILQEFNKNKDIFLSSTVSTTNVRNLINFTRESGSYIPLIISEKLNIFDENNKKITDSKLLKHKMIRCVFSPLCVDINALDNKFNLSFFGFSLAVMKNVSPPSYFLEELSSEKISYIGNQISNEKLDLNTNQKMDFTQNPFVTSS